MACADASAVGDGRSQRGARILDWLAGEARHLPDAPSLLMGLSRRLLAEGLPLGRVSVHLRVLHPQLFGMGFYWERGAEEVRVFRAERGMEQTDAFRRSPMAALLEGAGAVRQRLDLPDSELPFPLFYELRAEGVTDYVALPVTFSDGRSHGTTWASDRPGGFATAELQAIQEFLPIFGMLLEIHFNRLLAITLLDTYVGRHAGERILAGEITRGSGATLQAAVWFCDLRGFTAMSERLPRTELLDLLNQFFDAMAGAVERQGGEILKFIGDAMLAIFPLEGDRACLRALQAALDARARIAELNRERKAQDRAPLEYGIALHAGEVMYGNIGAANRLDFTVIGPAVNVASRIERLCRTLGPDVLLSEAFACGCAHAPFRSLGPHQLDGIEQEVEVFILPDAA